MKVGEAIDLAREWVETEGSRIQGFCGAHLMGSAVTLPPEANLPATSDLDLNVVVIQEQPTDVYNIPWQGLILEYGVTSRSAYAAPEAVLANPALACNLARASVLADPDGWLQALQREVSARYGERHWVRARCTAEKDIVNEHVEQVVPGQDRIAAAFAIGTAVLHLAGLLALADLRPPTHRRSLIVMQERLQAHGRPDLHEEALEVLGYAGLTRAEVERYLDDCAAAFDYATRVRRTAPLLAFKFQPHVRPYVVGGAREMIDDGYHREAMLWIEGLLLFSNLVIQADGTETEKPAYQSAVDALQATKAASTPGPDVSRRDRLERLVRAVFELCDRTVAAIPA
jgi:hypothetical protein